MSAPSSTLIHDRSKEDLSCCFFGSIIGGLAKLCSCSCARSSSSSPCDDTQSRRNEQFFEINIDEFNRNLTERLSEFSSNLPTGFQPVIEIPVAHGRQLYEADVESIDRQQKTQDQILTDLNKGDEEFARQSQEEEDRYAQKSAGYEYVHVPDTTGTLAERRQKRKKQEEFPVVHRAKDTFDLHDLVLKVQDLTDFGSSSNLPTSFQPVALGRQLYEADVESIDRQQKAQNQVLPDLIKKDKEFARQLQQEEERCAQKSAVPTSSDVSTRILADRRQKLKKREEFPVVHRAKNTFDLESQRNELFSKEYSRIHDTALSVDENDAATNLNNYWFIETYLKKPQEFPVVHRAKDTSDLHDLDSPRNELLPEECPEIYDTAASVDENDYLSATFYRDLAQQHLKSRNQFYRKGKRYLKENKRKRANFYFQKAKEQTKLYKQANDLAAATLLSENNDRNLSENIIDLHYLHVSEAIEYLDIFLDEEILSLENVNLQRKSVQVVTGRGKHSVNGIPRIKPAVIERLRQRNLKYSVINPGRLKVYVLKQSYLSNDLIT